MSGLEFEQKFVMDARYADHIKDDLVTRMSSTGEVAGIRQYYDKEGGRYRCTDLGHSRIYVKEQKRSIKAGTPYSITYEIEGELSEADFESGWEKNKNHRLQKTRYTIPGRYPDHKIMVDFFTTVREKEIYAVIAEVETMLTPTTTTLYLHFSLPIYLERYRLLTVDDSDPDMKIFKSANMVDQPDNIEIVKRTLSRLYD